MESKFWNHIYEEKSETEVSWFQEIPTQSLKFINELNLNKMDSIIDIGGGDSHLVDHLLKEGFSDISLLDISSVSLEKAKVRLGELSKSVRFIVSDVTKFQPTKKYKLWHDRATFHFLTNSQDIEAYLNIASSAIETDGFLIVSTFSKNGPDKCSGLPISQYTDSDLKNLFEKYFSTVKCFDSTHKTPWGTEQSFVYCGFKKKNL